MPATAPEQGDDVWDLLLERSPAAALSAALDLLAREDAAGRSWGRDLLRELAETDDGRPLMDELLASAGSAPVGPASEGHPSRLERGQLLFLNVDPHDFSDPAFTEDSLGVSDPNSRRAFASARMRVTSVARPIVP